MTKRIAVSLILVGGLAISLAPFPSEVSPPWHVQIVDQQGMPVAACRVTESWAWWPLGSFSSQNETLNTDGEGFVTFPRRMIWASPARRLLGRISARLSFHGGRYGPSATFFGVSSERSVGGNALDGTFPFDAETPGVVEHDGVRQYRAVLLSAAERDRLTGKSPPIAPARR
jgi:hypothetical protein